MSVINQPQSRGPLLLGDPADLATLLGLPWTDPLVDLVMRRASARFVAQIGYDPRPTTDTTWYSGGGGDILLLDFRGITAIEVTVDGVLLDAAAYEVAREDGILRRIDGHCWPYGLDNVEVTATHGWDPLPDDIVDAVLEAAEISANTQAGLASVGSGSEQITFGAASTLGVTQRWSDAVARWRLLRADGPY